MKRPVVLVIALIVVVAAIWFLRSKAERDAANAPSATGASLPGGPQKSPLANAASGPAHALPPREISDLARELNSPATDIRADLRLLGSILDTFRSNFPQTGNPAGNNAEITAILTGKNLLRFSVIPSDHPAINRKGELCDRWERPFFFHQLGATQMEIRSSGPDKKMWTEDDAVLTP